MVLETIKTRRSTRKFKPEMIPEESLEKIIEAGRYAPSGGNSQTTHFIVVENREVLDELTKVVEDTFREMEVEPGMYSSLVYSISASKKGGYIFHYNPAVLIITCNKMDYGNAMADSSCALENMMLEANELDLGSCWINQLRWLTEKPAVLDIMKRLGMADDERVFGAVAIGYADTESGLPERKPLERTGNPVTYVK